MQDEVGDKHINVSKLVTSIYMSRFVVGFSFRDIYLNLTTASTYKYYSLHPFLSVYRDADALCRVSISGALQITTTIKPRNPHLTGAWDGGNEDVDIKALAALIGCK